MDFLEKYYDKIKIENGKTVKYNYDGQNKTYFSDFYLPDYNLIVEIKSNYIYELEYEQNIMKQNACLNEYNYIFLINKNYEQLNKIIWKK